jgi:hypothetical protein
VVILIPCGRLDDGRAFALLFRVVHRSLLLSFSSLLVGLRLVHGFFGETAARNLAVFAAWSDFSFLRVRFASVSFCSAFLKNF